MNNQYPGKNEGTQLAPDEAAGAAVYFLLILAFVSLGVYAVASLFQHYLTLFLSTP